MAPWQPGGGTCGSPGLHAEQPLGIGHLRDGGHVAAFATLRAMSVGFRRLEASVPAVVCQFLAERADSRRSGIVYRLVVAAAVFAAESVPHAGDRLLQGLVRRTDFCLSRYGA